MGVAGSNPVFPTSGFVDFDFSKAPVATTEPIPYAVVITKILMSNTRILLSAGAFALATARIAAPVAANEEKRQVAKEESQSRDAAMEDKAGGTTARRSYTPEDFARFAPRSALDFTSVVSNALGTAYRRSAQAASGLSRKSYRRHGKSETLETTRSVLGRVDVGVRS